MDSISELLALLIFQVEDDHRIHVHHINDVARLIFELHPQEIRARLEILSGRFLHVEYFELVHGPGGNKYSIRTLSSNRIRIEGPETFAQYQRRQSTVAVGQLDVDPT